MATSRPPGALAAECTTTVRPTGLTDFVDEVRIGDTALATS